MRVTTTLRSSMAAAIALSSLASVGFEIVAAPYPDDGPRVTPPEQRNRIPRTEPTNTYSRRQATPNPEREARAEAKRARRRERNKAVSACAQTMPLA